MIYSGLYYILLIAILLISYLNFIFKETKREMKDVEEKLVRFREEVVNFTEHESQYGKKYYFNVKTNASTWEKPKCMDEIAGITLFIIA